MNPGGKIGYDENGQPVGVTEFEFAEEESARVDREAALEYERDKHQEVIRFIFEVLLCDTPKAGQVGKRAYFLASILKQSPFEKQSDLAAHLKITPGAVSHGFNNLCEQYPILARVRRDSPMEEVNFPALVR